MRALLQAHEMFGQLDRKRDEQVEEHCNILVRLCAMHHSEDAAVKAAVSPVCSEKDSAEWHHTLESGYGIAQEDVMRVGTVARIAIIAIIAIIAVRHCHQCHEDCLIASSRCCSYCDCRPRVLNVDLCLLSSLFVLMSDLTTNVRPPAGSQNLANLEVIASNYAKTQAASNKAVPEEWAAAGDWFASVQGDKTIYASACASSPSTTQSY